jgi:hypothetical protein
MEAKRVALGRNPGRWCRVGEVIPHCAALAAKGGDHRSMRAYNAQLRHWISVRIADNNPTVM